MLTLGIDIGGTSVKAAARESGRTLWQGQSAFYVRPTTELLTAAIREAVGGRASRTEAVGLCVPGLLDETRSMVMLSVNVPGLMNVPVSEIVGRALGFELPADPVVLNDAVATAHDIAVARCLRGRLLVLALGTGVGAAVVDDGRPLFVEGASPGHIGQLDVTVDDVPPIGPDGGSGGLEAYLGVPALVTRYGSIEVALERLDADAPPLRALVRAVRICLAIYRPVHVVLAGGVGVRISRLLPTIRGLVETNLTNVAVPGWTLTTADDDFHAARGAAALARCPASDADAFC